MTKLALCFLFTSNTNGDTSIYENRGCIGLLAKKGLTLTLYHLF